MYSKEEASQIRKKFWISFGQYMKLQPTASGLPVNWVNYKTGVKGINFKTDVDNKIAVVRIEINMPDTDIQHLVFEQFEEYKPVFDSYFEEEWNWLREVYDDHGRPVYRIETTLENISIFRESDWPEIIQFLKEKIIGIDNFWDDVKHGFDIFK